MGIIKLITREHQATKTISEIKFSISKSQALLPTHAIMMILLSLTHFRKQIMWGLKSIAAGYSSLWTFSERKETESFQIENTSRSVNRKIRKLH